MRKFLTYTFSSAVLTEWPVIDKYRTPIDSIVEERGRVGIAVVLVSGLTASESMWENELSDWMLDYSLSSSMYLVDEIPQTPKNKME